MTDVCLIFLHERFHSIPSHKHPLSDHPLASANLLKRWISCMVWFESLVQPWNPPYSLELRVLSYMDEEGEELLDKAGKDTLPSVSWIRIVWVQLQLSAERQRWLDHEDRFDGCEGEQELDSRNNEESKWGRDWWHFVRRHTPMGMCPGFHKTA